MERNKHFNLKLIFINCALFMLMIGFTACEKEGNAVGNNPKLQKFWKLAGYYDNDGKQINLPEFDPETLFHYEVNILFIWNEYTERYEIQGQGPHDIFWGEYLTPDDNSLKLNILKTTGIETDLEELSRYDDLYFHTLNNVTHYAIEGNRLKLFYGNDSKYMLFELKKEQHVDEEPYMTAEINGMKWESDPKYTSGSIDYDYQYKKFKVDFGTTSTVTDNYLADGLRYGLSFSINVMPKRGEFEFNNDGVTIELDGGVMGVCTAIDEKRYIDTRSTNGIIAITRLSRSFMQGYFHFDAGGTDKGITNKITNGKFFIPLSSPEIWFQKYEFKK